MAKYRKRPVVIEATQWAGFPELPALVGPFTGDVEWSLCPHCEFLKRAHGWVETYEGGHIACPTDWIITGVKGEHYPCKADIFEMTYERVGA